MSETLLHRVQNSSIIYLLFTNHCTLCALTMTVTIPTFWFRGSNFISQDFVDAYYFIHTRTQSHYRITTRHKTKGLRKWPETGIQNTETEIVHVRWYVCSNPFSKWRQKLLFPLYLRKTFTRAEAFTEDNREPHYSRAGFYETKFSQKKVKNASNTHVMRGHEEVSFGPDLVPFDCGLLMVVFFSRESCWRAFQLESRKEACRQLNNIVIST